MKEKVDLELTPRSASGAEWSFMEDVVSVTFDGEGIEVMTEENDKPLRVHFGYEEVTSVFIHEGDKIRTMCTVLQEEEMKELKEEGEI